MPDSPPREHSQGGIEENFTRSRRRLCDFCNESTALLYCRADNAKLCLSCDRQVHSTNQLFTKHTRSLLCDSCDSSPASIFCSTDAAVHCQNCDWETHNKSTSDSSPTHDRRPIEGFNGCPSVADLLAILGFEDLGKNGLFVGSDGFSDCLVWETPSFVSLDDLIVSSASDHNFQAMGVPPLPKNRNAASGTYKDELIRQLRELAKSEPNVDDSQDIIKRSLRKFEPNQGMMSVGLEQKSDQNTYSSYEANAFQWCYDSGQGAGYDVDTNCVFHEKDSDVGQSQPTAVENTQVFPPLNLREINSQERETAISRYKEKKKSRRYDKHIRYESRKVRAESRIRIRGRFAKMDR